MTPYFRVFSAGVTLLLLSIFLCSVAHAAPTVTLTANPTTGITPLSVTLNWSSTGAAVCTASGGWTGTKALSGSQVISNLLADTSFTLTCSAADGTATLTWTAPTQYTDGRTIVATGAESLKGFKAYYGTAGTPLNRTADIPNKAATTYTITGLTAATWDFAMTAYLENGMESALSNTATKVVELPATTATAAVDVSVKPKPPVLSTTITVAYEMNGIKNDGTIRLGRDVGTVALGTPCIDYEFVTDRGTYYGIDRENVELYRTPKSSMIVTKCEWTG
jgi:hypothetical protein